MAGIVKQFTDMIGGFSLMRKASMAAVLVLSVVAIVYLVKVTNKTSLEPLFTNLNSEDIGSILTFLDKQNVRYEVDQDKRTIMVPSAEVLDVRLKLAGEGMPRFGGVGFELFDKNNFGLSEFEQRVIYQRALEGELSRTIGGIKEVQSARVHLMLPEKSLFAESQQSATASVILKLGSDGALARDKVNSITHLVASAVDGLDSNQVTVVDNTGRLLTSGAGDDSIMAGGQVFDQKMQIERSIEKRIVELLAPVVGLGKVMARVTANIDFTSTESTDEIFDPTKSAIVSESRSTSKKTENGGGGGGAAGAAANLPGGGGAAGGGGNSGSEDGGTEQIAYQVSKTIRRQVTPMGSVKNLSVAILVDGTYADNNGEKVYAARSAEELAKLEDLIKKAIGYTQDRGDQIKIENMAFQATDLAPETTEGFLKDKTTYGFLVNIVGNVLVVLMLLLVFFFVVRPMVRSWGGVAGQVGAFEGNAPMLEGEIRTNVANLVRTDPLAAANAIRQWLK